MWPEKRVGWGKMLRVSLFDRFTVRGEGRRLEGCELGRVRELFGYLLLNRHRAHTRETVASQLWGDHYTTAGSRTQLRKALWQLQSALHPEPSLDFRDVLLVDAEWIRINPTALWLDVAELEDAYLRVRETPGACLDEPAAQSLARAAALYKEDLLDGWAQDWCLCERERLRHVYLVVTDKLASYFEARQAYEPAIRYAMQILRFDRAREHTHRQLMRLHYLAGDPGGAVAQFDACVAVLREELDVGPARSTLHLKEQILAGRSVRDAPGGSGAAFEGESPGESSDGSVAAHLRELYARVDAIEAQLHQMISTTDRVLGSEHDAAPSPRAPGPS